MYSYRMIFLIVYRNGNRSHQLVSFEASFFALQFLNFHGNISL